MIATEFKYHHVGCYRNFTRNIDNAKESVQHYKNGDFVKVEKFIMEIIIKVHQVASWRNVQLRIEKQFAKDILYLYNNLFQTLGRFHRCRTRESEANFLLKYTNI